MTTCPIIESGMTFGSFKADCNLQPKAQLDTLVAQPDSIDRAKATFEAMESMNQFGEIAYDRHVRCLMRFNENLARVHNLLLLKLMNGEVKV